MNHHRTISWWITWEDLDFPNTAIEEKILARARAAADAGVETAIIFGLHFRWDFVCCFETVHALLKFIADACHAYGIQLIDHHSATLTHRPRSRAGREDTFRRNHHHVPFTPDRDVAAYLQYHGTRLNSWRERRVDTGEPAFIECYQSELFCTNNPDFVAAYISYVERLFRETGIDGLMCDDIGRYAHWSVCGCDFCRQDFRMFTGRSLPPGNEWSFWGNFDNPHFRQWVIFRHNCATKFLSAVRTALPGNAFLTSCCCGSIDKSHDADVVDISNWHPALNMLMLEMCGSIADDKLSSRVADMLLQHSIARTRGIPVLGAGYAYYPDEAFLIWSWDRFFNNDVWISSHKTRLGIGYAEQNALPDEPEMVREAFLYEKKYAELFEVDDLLSVGLYYSAASRSFNGDAAEDYSAGVTGTAQALYSENIHFSVFCTVPDPTQVPILIAPDCNCLRDDEISALETYRKRGGILILCGLFGNCDHTGTRRETPPLLQYGVRQEIPQLDRGIPDKERFFEQWGWRIHRAVPGEIPFSLSADTPLRQDGFHQLADRLFWSPFRLHLEENRAKLLRFLSGCLPPAEFSITLLADATVRHRLYQARNGDGFTLHCMPVNNMKVVFHPSLRFQQNGPRIIREIHYTPLAGELRIRSRRTMAEAELYSPDLPAPHPLPVAGGREICVPLSGLKRFFSIRIRQGFSEQTSSTPTIERM